MSAEPKTESDKQGERVPIGWKIAFGIAVLMSAVLFTFAIADASIQLTPHKFVRQYAVALDADYDPIVFQDDDDSNDYVSDTTIPHTASFLFAAPLRLASYLFTGFFLAYFTSRGYDKSAYFLSVTRRDGLLFGVVGAVALACLAVAWAHEDTIRSTWNAVNHTATRLIADGIYDDSDVLADNIDIEERDLNYIIYWGASPFTSRSSYVYVSVAVAFLFVLLQTVFMCVLCLVNQKSRNIKRAEQNTTDIKTPVLLVKITAGMLSIAATLLVVFLFVVVAAQSNGTRYWLMFTNSNLLSVAFVFAGWSAYMLVTNSFWLSSLAARSSRDTVYETVFVSLVVLTTVVVGLLSSVFCMFEVISLFNDCDMEPLDTHSDLYHGVCKQIASERHAYTPVDVEHDTKTVHIFYVIFSLFLLVAVVFHTAMSVIATLIVVGMSPAASKNGQITPPDGTPTPDYDDLGTLLSAPSRVQIRGAFSRHMRSSKNR